MSPIEYLMVHSCTISHTSQDQKLSFVSGSVAFLVGKIITGSVSDSTGIIKTVVVESGSWSGEDASGYLILSSVSGSFKSGEKIMDDQTLPGEATVSGVLIPQTDDFGTPTTTTFSTPSKCLFSESDTSGFGGSGIIAIEGGEFVSGDPIVFLPAETDIEEGDIIKGESPGFIHDYKVKKVSVRYRMFTTIVQHIEAQLRTVEKQHG